MYQRPLLDVSDAMAIVDAMLQAAPGRAENPLALAVTDQYGDLLGFARMDGATPFACQNAISKAYTAARLRLDARELAERLRSQSRSITELADPKLVGSLGGGLVIVYRDAVVGAIGVSGGAPDQDDAVAQAGMNALGL
ncbi:MAG: GlcG/HbpS family heme-binding protein [Chloroflexota bacterium]